MAAVLTGWLRKGKASNGFKFDRPQSSHDIRFLFPAATTGRYVPELFFRRGSVTLFPFYERADAAIGAGIGIFCAS
jgi:hypothetical protein